MNRLIVKLILSFFIFLQLSADSKIKKSNAIYPSFDDNPFLSEKMRGKLFPYLLPLDHPAKDILDKIFFKTRATLNLESFKRAGFEVISTRPCSYILVAANAEISDYLVKIYLDNEHRLKQGIEGWKWLISRCRGANKIREVIERKNFTHFVVPRKWIYPLPVNPSLPDESVYSRKEVILVVEKMDLVNYEENLIAWKTKITYRHLEELYAIISRAGGSSYRPDNIAYTKEGKFAFIDTEYPSKYPDYKSINSYLSDEMLAYWKVLIRAGQL